MRSRLDRAGLLAWTRRSLPCNRAIAMAFVLGGCGGPSDGRDLDASAGGSDGSRDASRGGGTAACSPSTLQDTFTAAALDNAAWRRVGVNGWTVAPVDGRLAFTPDPAHNNTRAGGVRSIPTMNLTGCATWLEVVRTFPPGHPGELVVNVSTESGATVGAIWVRRERVVTFRVYQGSSFVDESVPYDAVMHRWWRFRDAGGELAIETSPDAQSWTTRLQRPHGADLTAVKLWLSANEASISAGFDGPLFDNINVVP